MTDIVLVWTKYREHRLELPGDYIEWYTEDKELAEERLLAQYSEPGTEVKHPVLAKYLKGHEKSPTCDMCFAEPTVRLMHAYRMHAYELNNDARHIAP